MVREWIRRYRESSVKARLAMLLCLLGAICLLYICLCLMTGAFLSSFAAAFGHPERTMLMLAFSSQGKSISFILLIVLCALLLYIGLRQTRRNALESTDSRGVGYMKKKTFGSSRWMYEEEIAEKYVISNASSTTSTILGQLSESGEKTVSMKQRRHGSTSDSNFLIIGSPGTGKSYCYVRTELIQTLLRGDSFVVTDPSGELYASLSSWCRSQGADVKVLNLYEPDYSDFWNPLMETLDEEKGVLSPSRLIEFISIYMDNSSGEDKSSFWFNCSKNLMTAVVALCAYRREVSILSGFRSFYRRECHECANFPERIELMSAELNASIREVRGWIIEDCCSMGMEREQCEVILDGIEEDAVPFNMDSVRDAFFSFEKTEAELKILPEWHPGSRAYYIFSTNNAATVRDAAIQNTMMNMQTFTDEKLCAMLSRSSINIRDINRKKCAWFVITDDKTKVTKPLASLFFSFLIKDLQDNYDFAQHNALASGKGNPCLPVTLMLDEFFSVGVIGGDPNVFATTMSDIRKREAHISLIVQSISQISQLYGRDNANTIITCCSTVIFLGCNDLETAGFISRKTGESTVLSESHEEDGNIDHLKGSYSMSAGRRTLLTEDEVSRWENRILVLKRGCFPMDLLPFPWTSHPEFVSGNVRPVSIYSEKKPILERIADRMIAKADNAHRSTAPATEELPEQIERQKPKRGKRGRGSSSSKVND